MVWKGMVSGRVLHDMASGLGVSDMLCCAVRETCGKRLRVEVGGRKDCHLD